MPSPIQSITRAPRRELSGRDASSEYGLACVARDSIAATSEGGAVR